MANNNDGVRPRVSEQIDSIRSNEEDGNNTTFSINYIRPSLNETEMVAVAFAISHSTQVKNIDLSYCLRGSSATATFTFLQAILETHPSIKEIDLGSNNINSILAEVIGAALKSNTSLKELKLCQNIIGPQGAEALADGLCCNKTLQLLLLSGNTLGDQGSTALAEALRNNKTLEELCLWHCGITEGGAKALASALEKASLKVLELDYNEFNDEGGTAIAQSLCKNKSLVQLELRSTGIGDDTCKALAAALCNNSSLRELNFRGNSRITDAGAKSIELTLKHLNYSVENIRLGFRTGVTGVQRDRIYQLCERNASVRTFFLRVNQNIPAIPLGMWPKVLENVECKPDLLFALLKTKPEVCRKLQRKNRRRSRPDWLRY